MRKFVGIAAIGLTCLTVAACTAETNSASETTEAVSDDPVGDVFDADYAGTKKICVAYFSLVNQGWTDDDIYSQLDHAGAFDGMPDAEDGVFHRLVRWCYDNN